MVIKLPNSKQDNLKSFAEEFVFSDSLVKLVKLFGGEYPSQNLNECLSYLLKFSDKWDYRSRQQTENKENARWLISEENFTSEQNKAIDQASFDLNLRENSIPSRNRYDYIWVLGGAKLSCLLRTRLAKEVYDKLQQEPSKIAMLASFRPLNDSERQATDTYARCAETEFDLFLEAHKLFFNSKIIQTEESSLDERNPNKKWKIINFENNTSIFSSPSREPEARRANSLDTYLFFMERHSVKPGSKILLVTSEIYVPYQHLEALRSVAIPFNVEIETIGFPAEWGGELQGMSNKEHYLQELRSTIQSLSRLWNTEVNDSCS
jgi:uncharacterized protein rv3785/MT3893